MRIFSIGVTYGQSLHEAVICFSYTVAKYFFNAAHVVPLPAGMAPPFFFCLPSSTTASACGWFFFSHALRTVVKWFLNLLVIASMSWSLSGFSEQALPVATMQS